MRSGLDADRLVQLLAAATCLSWIGAGAILPLLPLYVKRHGGSDALVGAVVAAFFVGGTVCRYPAGRLSDRFGGRAVLVGGLVCYGLGSVGFLLPIDVGADVAMRALQGVGAGSAEVAALTMVAAAVAPERRGRAFGIIYGSQLGGLAVGPLAGSLVGLSAMAWVFTASAAAAALSCVPVILASPVAFAPEASPTRPEGRGTGISWIRAPGLVGVLVAGLAVGFLIGIYESCWSLLLHSKGATSAEIGISWTLYCIPFVATSLPAGKAADRMDRRWLVVASLFGASLFALAYPHIDTLWVLIGLGAAESLATTVGVPALQSLLSGLTPTDHLGRMQGIFFTAQTGVAALVALADGALFELGDWVPFTFSGVAVILLTATLPWCWRRVDGKVAPAVPGTLFGAQVTP
jgi:MFS family permease